MNKGVHGAPGTTLNPIPYKMKYWRGVNIQWRLAILIQNHQY